MERLWTRLASLALASLLALAVGGVVTAHARTVGEVIDDTRIVAEVTARLTADSLSNFVKIDVKAESGIVTLSGTVDSADKHARAVQIARAVGGVKGVVDNIHVTGTTPTDSTSTRSRGAATIDATGTVAAIDAASGTITLSDGRVLRAGDRATLYQSTTVQALKPGDRVVVRGATPVTVRAPEIHMGTVARVDTARQQLVLTDGSVVHVGASTNVHRGTERLTLAQIEPGAEVVIQLSPMPSASPGTTTARTTPDLAAALDASDVSVVWTPSAASR